MKIFVHSHSGDGVGLAQQMAQEGHEVLLYLKEPNLAPVFEGILWKTDDWETAAQEADITFFDVNGDGARAESLRAKGLKVWGGGRLADRLENDRMFGMEVMKRGGLRIPETFDFKTPEEAKRIAQEIGEKAVIKLNAPDVGKDTSFVADDAEQLVERIDEWEKRDKAYFKDGGIVQRFIEGTEISVEGWFNGDRFLYPFNVTMEDKKLLNDDKGPNTGCAQNVVKQLRAEHPRIARELLEPLVPVLQRGKFCGQIDVNCIVSDEDRECYALEFTPRAGYDATSTLVVGLPGYGEAMARALGLRTCNESEGCQCPPHCSCLQCGSERPPFWYLGAVRVYLPPYPFECSDEKLCTDAYSTLRGTEIAGWLDGDQKTKDRVVLFDAMMEDGKVVVAGTSGIAYIALGHGPDLGTMAEDTYKHLGEVKLANASFRTDLGRKQARAWPKIEHLLR